MTDTVEGHPRPVTMGDVAKAANVSASTVSHVINNNSKARIGKAARDRVHEAVRELGYRPNALAKTLVTGRSRFLGLVADAIASTPFAGQIIHGAQDEAWRHGYVLLVANTEGNDDAESDAIAMMLEHKVRGILYSTWYHHEVVLPPGLTETDYVLVNCSAAGGGSRAVVPDEVAGGREATRMLLDRGHRRIAMINTSTPSPARRGRLKGYRLALADAGIPFDAALVVDARPDQEGGFAAVDELLARKVSAVFCHNDRVAMGLYDGLRERGLRVPDDLAVVGFDDQQIIAAHLRPPLSTIALPHYELGATGVRMLLDVEQPVDGQPVTIDCPPVHRQSIGAHRTRPVRAAPTRRTRAPSLKE